MSEALGLKNVNMLSKEQYDGIEDVAKDELYAISGSGFGFPSERYDDLELGASGTFYTAPANGYFYLQMKYVADRHIDIYNTTSNTGCIMSAASSGVALRAMAPCKKGDVVCVYYTASSVDAFQFRYAEGE